MVDVRAFLAEDVGDGDVTTEQSCRPTRGSRLRCC